ncbi:uncharacterized protein B0P05DRAFT_551648 [Gilbertella persicaria]|uniref:uncharacterized protein n=1 Tax=Gilbertella persicaria TaxID=101096 RepID=UPI00221FEE93|nr:uncharacterized protein B0P05DRAFT_551648 [Gilbertella persicaria]KAI8069126.1 hypothetical protein B0P05DRAFT_551648 [Gilbertella persicaria]
MHWYLLSPVCLLIIQIYTFFCFCFHHCAPNTSISFFLALLLTFSFDYTPKRKP